MILIDRICSNAQRRHVLIDRVGCASDHEACILVFMYNCSRKTKLV